MELTSTNKKALKQYRAGRVLLSWPCNSLPSVGSFGGLWLDDASPPVSGPRSPVWWVGKQPGWEPTRGSPGRGSEDKSPEGGDRGNCAQGVTRSEASLESLFSCPLPPQRPWAVQRKSPPCSLKVPLRAMLFSSPGLPLKTASVWASQIEGKEENLKPSPGKAPVQPGFLPGFFSGSEMLLASSLCRYRRK